MGRGLGGGRREPPGLRRGAGRRGTARNGLSLRRQSGDVRAHRQLQERPGACAGDIGKARAMSGYTLATSPMLPWAAIAVFAAVAALVLLYGAVRRARGIAWRVLAVVAL